MKNREKVVDLRVRSALKECAQHQARLHAAWVEAVTFPALKEGARENHLTEAHIRTLDQLLFRFGKLQDAMGARLLPAVMQQLQEWQEHEPFLDTLNRAEKLGMLSSVEQWLLVRELRNQTAHDYPEQPERMLAGLRRLVSHVPLLVKLHAQLASMAEQRIHPPQSL